MYARLPVQAYRVYLLQGPSKGPHNLTSTGPHLSYIRHCMYNVCIKEGDYGLNHHFNIDNQSGDIIMEKRGNFEPKFNQQCHIHKSVHCFLRTFVYHLCIFFLIFCALFYILKTLPLAKLCFFIYSKVCCPLLTTGRWKNEQDLLYTVKVT